ncbi:MAG TPA: UDP-N-acetylglucosamine 1-carboxyvinyltransferase [Dehalococcoidia bacterium]|nr:UDP-N-acetylglucosamine 1-carboxyvinyltransferase [Dehalococcoidia bacterium]
MALNVVPRTFVIEGGQRLSGTVEVGGSKNATLGAMAAALLVPDECILENVPHIDDVEQMALVLRSVGCIVEWKDEHTLRLNAAEITASMPDPELVGMLRGSFLVFGALLARLGEASCPPPGGDVIGQRPIDVHLAGFRALGAQTEVEQDMFHARASDLRGSTFFADYPSVLGTQNTMMAAVVARGTTTIINAAAEPEVQSLANMLKQMGARIEGAGTHTITIHGAESMGGTIFRIIPDRIVAGTYAVAAALTGGVIELTGTAPEHMGATLAKLRQVGAEVTTNGDRMTVRRDGDLRSLTLQALPYPGFATDLQAPMAVLLTQASGVSYVHERVFDNRLGYISDLRKMGAEIVTTGTTVAIITGPAPLTGASLRALDVRAGAAFILAGLAARGRTEIHDIYHVDRGYEKIDEKLRSLGAAIERQ